VKQAAQGRELMRKRMKFYLAPVAAVLFRVRYTRVPQRVYFLWNPQDLAVADRLCSYARLTRPPRHPPQLPRADGVAGIYSVWLVGAIQGVVARFDADAAPVAAERNCQHNIDAGPSMPVSIGLSVF